MPDGAICASYSRDAGREADSYDLRNAIFSTAVLVLVANLASAQVNKSKKLVDMLQL
jgi:hypothetical protein